MLTEHPLYMPDPTFGEACLNHVIPHGGEFPRFRICVTQVKHLIVGCMTPTGRCVDHILQLICSTFATTDHCYT